MKNYLLGQRVKAHAKIMDLKCRLLKSSAANNCIISCRSSLIWSTPFVKEATYDVFVIDLLGLTLRLLVSSADNLCKQLGPRSGPTTRLA